MSYQAELRIWLKRFGFSISPYHNKFTQKLSIPDSLVIRFDRKK